MKSGTRFCNLSVKYQLYILVQTFGSKRDQEDFIK